MKGDNSELTQEDSERILKSILEKIKNREKITYPIHDDETFEAEDEPQAPYSKRFEPKIQELVRNSELVLEQVRQEHAKKGITMVTFDKDICKENEVMLTFPDGSIKIKNCKTNELRIL
jgi:hypothetical protein